MEQGKLYSQMTVDEQVKYLTDLSEFVGEKLPRLERIGDAWEHSDRKDMETGLRLLCAFQFARDFVDKALRYGDYAARARRLRVYIDKVKTEISKGLAMKGSDGHQYAIVPATVPQRRRGRPTLQEQEARKQGIAVRPSTDPEMERQIKIARLMGIEVVIDESTAPRDLNNAELAEERQRRAEEKAKQSPSLFGNEESRVNIGEGQPAAAPQAESQPAAHGSVNGCSSAVPTSPSAVAASAPNAAPASVAASAPLAPAATWETDYRLSLAQKRPFLTPELAARADTIRALRTTAAASAERAKLLAEQGADPDTVAPYAQEAQDATEHYEAIYRQIDEELATVYYRLLNDGPYRDKWLQRFNIKSMDDVNADLMYDLKKHYRKMQSAEFDLRCRTLIEQESPEYVARMKAEAEKKKEIQDLLRYIRRTDKPLTKTRLIGLQNRLARLAELDPEEAKVQEPIVRKAEEDFAKSEAGKKEKSSTDTKTKE